MHWDNIEWSDEMSEWLLEPENKQSSKPGDDRTPAWTWMGALYHDGKLVAVPQENVMKALTDAGAQVPTGKGKGTFKKIVPGGIIPLEEFFEFQSAKGSIRIEEVWQELREEPRYVTHTKHVQTLGFRLYAKRARVGMSKHIRVRPRFDEWSLAGRVLVRDERITEKILQTIVTIAGDRMGLGDWRPSAPKSPGPFGRFEAEVKAVG
jgi:hypothetical protein